MIHSSGVELHFEPYGGPFDSAAAAIADVPMVEFWTGGRASADPTIVGAGRAADRRVIAAEAFTGRPERSQWTETPADLKVDGDAMLASGVNRLVLHHWVHQPFDERYRPGMGMGWWGTHFGRNQTWYEPGKAFIEYLWRIQSLLQYGQTPIDMLSVGTSREGSDVLPWSQFLTGSLTVIDGIVVTPHGRRYRLLDVPHDGYLLPEATAEIGRLLRLGATVCASRPSRLPSLQNYPSCDEAVRRLSKEIWGPSGNTPRVVGIGHPYGDGHVSRAMKSLSLSPRLVASNPALRHVCREGDEGTVLFVANLSSERLDARLLATNEEGRPELWDPYAKQMRVATVYRSTTEGTEVPISLGPGDSVFLVLRAVDPEEGPLIRRVHGPSDLALRREDGGTYAALSADGGEIRCEWTTGEISTHRIDPQPPVAIEGPWAVELVPAVGSASAFETGELFSLAESDDPVIRFFAGAATYATEFMMDREILERSPRIDIDLGRVGDLAEVWINDRTTGVMWRPPMSRDIRPMLRPGRNEVRIVVWNTWHNRLVGDEQFASDFILRRDRGADLGRGLAAFPDWLVEGQPRPSAHRLTFTTWLYHRRNTPLLPAGLIGPMRLLPFGEVALRPATEELDETTNCVSPAESIQ